MYATGICYVDTLFIPTEYCRIEWYVGCTRLGQDHHVHFQSPWGVKRTWSMPGVLTELKKLLPSHRKFFSNWRQEGVYIQTSQVGWAQHVPVCISWLQGIGCTELNQYTCIWHLHTIYGHKVSAPSAANQKMPCIKFTQGKLVPTTTRCLCTTHCW